MFVEYDIHGSPLEKNSYINVQTSMDYKNILTTSGTNYLVPNMTPVEELWINFKNYLLAGIDKSARIFKKGDKYNPSNYRPISLTCITYKVMEHTIVINIMKHVSNNNILSDFPHGFRNSAQRQGGSVGDGVSSAMLVTC